MRLIRRLLTTTALLAAALLSVPASAQATHAGLRSFKTAGDAPLSVALFYPTAVPARAIPMGPWLPQVAPGAPAADGPLKGLVLVSHGTGGSELNQHTLATSLARAGYLVAAVRHAGDDWQDRSLVGTSRYFSERPAQLSRVLDALLASPDWGPRIPAGRIAAVGHSAGGYSVLALAGAQADAQRVRRHCQAVQDDPGFCALAKGPGAAAAAAAPQAATAAPLPDALAAPAATADPRIRAVVALAPMAVVFTPESLAAVAVPVRVWVAEHDAVLTTRHHGGHVLAHLPRAQGSTVAGAGHFAFMDQPTHPLPSAAGDAAANPPGFDRPAFLARLDREVLAFLDAQLR